MTDSWFEVGEGCRKLAFAERIALQKLLGVLAALLAGHFFQIGDGIAGGSQSWL